MKKIYYLLLSFWMLFSISSEAQERKDSKKIRINGIIIEKISQQPLEYATLTIIKNGKIITGAITNAKGEFEVVVNPGLYTIKAEFISFKIKEFKDKKMSEDTNLGIISLVEDVTQLNQVEIRRENSTVEIKLDKKVYNVGQDLIIKGGTVSDVLDNIPSVTVDVEGNVSLRGNSNVRILIDGKPSNAINITDALRLIPADAIEKVEVITNPSARYDAEGGGGILNIILKRGKNLGLNGTILLSVGTPENTGFSGNFNLKTTQFNLFSSLGYNKSNSPGNAKFNQENYDTNRNLISYIEERRKNNRQREGFNGNFGIELYLDKTSSWTNTLSFRKNNGGNPETVTYSKYSNIGELTKTQRFNDSYSSSLNLEYSTNYTKKFKKEGHKLTIDGSFSQNTNLDYSTILGTESIPDNKFVSSERTNNEQKQGRNLIQTDYVLPLGKNSQFEAGFRGNYSSLLTDYKVEEDVLGNNNFTINTNFTNDLDYKENVTAFYSQFGSKISKFSYLLGLRFEDSKIIINQLTTQDFNTKKYNNLFPSAFLTYEITEESSLSLNYSKRITRPRDRFINPFSSYSSNINLFQGNPDLNPAYSDSYDFDYLKKWKKITLNSSVYFNKTSNSFQIVQVESGRFIDGNPVIINTPFNLATNNKFGFEFTLNYSPYRWWKLNSNFNFFSNTTEGNYTFTNASNTVETINFNNSASNWFARVNSKFNLPYKFDFQINGNYNAAQKTAQGNYKANASANLAISKDLFKEKATLTFNVSDIFNSRKRITDLNLPNVHSYGEMQWRQRQLTLSFTYRFNKAKNEKERQSKKEGDSSGGDDFSG